jgi:RNA polymerase sigma-70 factor (ECF subfamily)
MESLIGTADNLEQVVKQYRKTVFRVALGYVKNIHDADDIAQNVFMKYLTKTENVGEHSVFESEEARKAWLIRVAVNESKNLLKSAWLRKRSDLDESLVAPDNDSLGIFDYVKKLKPKYRTVVYLFYHERYSQKEIADILSLKVSTVATQLQRAREQLKDIITKEEDYYGRLQFN